MTPNHHAKAHLVRRALTLGGSLVAVGVLVPAALVQIAGWPLPNSMPNLGDTLTSIQQQNPPDGLVIGLFATLAWLLWLQLAWAFVWELVVNTRRLARGLDVRPAPFVMAAVNGVVSRVASGTVALSLLASSPVAAAALPVVPVPTSIDAQSVLAQPASSSVRGRVREVAPASQWRVAEEDTAWSIAETALGDGSRFAEVVVLNAEVRSPRDVVEGMVLTLPEGAQIPQARYPAEHEDPKTAGGASQAHEFSGSASVHTVVEGEHLWAISESVLESRIGTAPHDAATASLVLEFAHDNADIIENPNLIFPGQLLVIPGESESGSPAPPAADSYVPAHDVVIVEGDHLWGLSEQRLETASGVEVSDVEILEHVNTVIGLNADIIEDPDLIYPGEVFAFPAIGSERSVQVEAAQPDPVAPPATPVSVPEVAAPTAQVVAPGSADGAEGRSVLPYLLGLLGATVLASSLLTVVRTRRQRREALGVNTQPVAEFERTITAAANLPLMRWAGQELSVLTSSLDPALAATIAPVAVEVSETGLELLWEDPAPIAPHPWEATDGGAAWRLLFDADAPIPADELPPAMPGLVTVGARPGEGVVLLDLESFGSVAMTGDETAVQDFARSIALELGSGSDLASADVVTVGFEFETSDHFPRIKSASVDETLDLLRSTVAQYDAMLEESDCVNAFQLRCVTGPGPDVIVAVVSAERCSRIEEMIEIAGRRRGAVVLVVGESSSANAQMSVSADGSCFIEPLGLRVDAPIVTKQAVTELATCLESLSAIEPLEPIAVAADHAVVTSEVASHDVTEADAELDDSGDEQVSWLSSMPVDLEQVGADLDDDDDDWAKPESALIVRLLGEPHALGFDLPSRQIGLLALIASKGGTASAECVLDHLWADQTNARTRKTLWNLESQTRSSVGPEIFPHSPKNQPLRTTATTDLAIFEALVSRAETASSSKAMPLLEEALDLVSGSPFDHGHFEWARSIGVYDSARQMIEATALRLCELALEAGDTDVARRAIAQGLLGLGVNEPLYRSRMNIEGQAGDRGAVLRVYAELEERLELLFGDATPSATTRRLRDELMRPASVAHGEKQSA